MKKRAWSIWGKLLFLSGFLIFIIGSPASWLLFWLNIDVRPLVENMFIISGIGLCLILASFVCLSLGSRVGDQHE